MILTTWDYVFIAAFVGFFLVLIIRAFLSKDTYPDYFNAGGNLHWLVIGFAILGSNIGLDNIQSSAANGLRDGLAFGSYEWTASFVIVLAALYIIPYFMRVGVLTLPEYLGARFNRNIRVIMAFLFILLHVGMLSIMLISCSQFLQQLLGLPKYITIAIAAIAGGTIIIAGGMGSKIRLDIVVVSIFFIVGTALIFFCFSEIGGFENFYARSDGRLNAILPSNHPALPWNSVFVGGLWVLHLNFWCFFQPIAQTPLISNSLSQTQKGLLFVATAKLILPFLFIVPGIIGYELFSDVIKNPDLALPVVIQNVAPTGFAGLFILGYTCTILAIYNGYVTATSNVFTLDIYKTFRPEVSGQSLVRVAKITSIVFVGITILLGEIIEPGGALLEYNYLFLACAAPISTSVFLVAIFSRKTPAAAAYAGIFAGIPVFFYLKENLHISMVDLSGVTFVVLIAIMMLIRLLFPLKTPVKMKEKLKVKFERNLGVVIWSIFLFTCVLSIYLILS